MWKPHAWKLRSDYFVVTVHIQVSEDADEQGIKDQAIMLLKRCGCTDVTLQVPNVPVWRVVLTHHSRALGCVVRGAG